eukprot:CAMPEP_0185594768 /NCGR_PEP_ID=MMETSP0434-20130131/76066_1 /TAXON_ID=626734 ORGANISM="Favella taraikaensis, Strain Fe Narragansett Bay" /NCGR_SAMPLE_ID=MMETSP0434 /ASSEMBLY_ACC=CAM_ASM_000379 /LENGTH=139 /DNA_ID=CAMNT_0028222313 /DNA_START=319 /DNA_END=734 /DNA_ORIENTATION=-
MLQSLSIEHHIVKGAQLYLRAENSVITRLEDLLVDESVCKESDSHSKGSETQIFILLFKIAQGLGPIIKAFTEEALDLIASLDETVALLGWHGCQNGRYWLIFQHFDDVGLCQLSLMNDFDWADLADECSQRRHVLIIR